MTDLEYLENVAAHYKNRRARGLRSLAFGLISVAFVIAGILYLQPKVIGFLEIAAKDESRDYLLANARLMFVTGASASASLMVFAVCGFSSLRRAFYLLGDPRDERLLAKLHEHAETLDA